MHPLGSVLLEKLGSYNAFPLNLSSAGPLWIRSQPLLSQEGLIGAHAARLLLGHIPLLCLPALPGTYPMFFQMPLSRLSS